LWQLLKMESPEKETLDDDPYDRNHASCGDNCEYKTPGFLDHRQTYVASEQVERSVREIKDFHQTENKRQARGQQKEQHSKRNAVECLH